MLSSLMVSPVYIPARPVGGPLFSMPSLAFSICTFFLFLAPLQHLEFLGQRSNKSQSLNLCHSCSNAGSLTHFTRLGIELQRHCQAHCTTVETPICRFFDDGHSDWCEVKPHCSFDLNFSNNQ